MQDQRVIESLLPQPELSFGVGGIAFSTPDSLATDQAGYEGPDWRRSWLVVARDTCCGDPIFVDRADPALPVLTAMHGVGYWEPEHVAPSWEKFLSTLEFVRPYTQGREHPVGLQQYPLSNSERQSLHDGLVNILGAPVPHFWELLFQDPEP